MALKERTEIEVDGQLVVGMCKRDFHDVSVEIVAPYKNLRTSCHIPAFAGAMNYYGEYGDKRIAGLLQELYQFGAYLDRNLDSLRRFLPPPITYFLDPVSRRPVNDPTWFMTYLYRYVPTVNPEIIARKTPEGEFRGEVRIDRDLLIKHFRQVPELARYGGELLDSSLDIILGFKELRCIES